MSDVRIDAAPKASRQKRSNSHGSFIWYELMTPDPEGAKPFYEAVVGWTVGDPSPEFNGYRMIGRSDGGYAGGVLELTEDMHRHGARPIWLGYVCVDDVDQSVRLIGEAGGKLLMPAADIPNVGRIAMVTDPQGAPLYVMRPTPPAADPSAQSDVFSVDQPQHVRWNELMTGDPDAAVAFYQRHFGWSQEGEMPMGELGAYRFIQNNGVAIGAVMKRPLQVPVSLWTYYIGVDDIDRAVAAIEGGGGKIVNGPMEIPGGEFALNGVDPQGAAFGLVGPRKS